MDGEHKDYLYKNEISLSIGDDSVDSSVSTPSTVTPTTIPTPSPRQNAVDDKKPLTKTSGNMSKPEGIDNKAFEATEKSGKPLTSFGNGHSNNNLNDSGANGANKNGQLNEKKLAEAVNLELININNNAKKPTNGKHNKTDLPAKKDSDVEVGNTKDDSYDEYFVPVNKHRKYMGFSNSRKLHGVGHNGLSLETPEYGIVNYNEWMDNISRGEKLYVTQDKRSKSGKNRLCWIVCIGLVAAVILLGILAASGVFSKTESAIEARNLKANANDSIAVAGFGGSAGLNQQPDSTPLPSTTESTLPPIVDTTPPEDLISYVPNTLEGQITLSNADYSDEYNDPNSPIYKKLIRDLENEIKSALSEKGDEEFFIKIIGLKPGSVVVDYRVSWKDSNSEMSSEEMMSRIENFLQKNNQQFMSRYLVNLNAIRTARVPDRCATSDKNSCDEGCEFSAEKVDFVCTCPAHKKYDEDFKECVSVDDSIYTDDTPLAEPEPKGDNDHSHDHSHTGHESTSEPSSEPEPSGEPGSHDHSHDHEHDHHAHHITHVNAGTKDSTPEPSGEPSSEPEPTSEPKSEPEPSSNKDHDSHHFTHINADTKNEESKDSSPEPSGEPSSEPEPTSEPKSEPEPTNNKDHDHDSHHITHVAGTGKEESKDSSPEPSGEPSSEPEPTGEPSSEPEPTSEPKSKPEPSSDHDHSHHLIYNNAGVTSTEEPKAEPEPTKDDHSHDHSHSNHESTSEPSSEPKSEPTTHTDDEGTVHHSHHLIYNNAGVTTSTEEPKAEPEPSSEPSSEPTKEKSETVYTGEKKSKVLEETRTAEESTSSKPVSEDFDDTPRPTENYFSINRGKDLKNDVNIFDMNSTTQSSSNTTIYSTATPIHLWVTENATHAEHANDSHDMSPFLPAAEVTKTQEKPVTENVLESEAPHNQSPFLPELENNETLHHILHGAHGMSMTDESDESNKTFSITVTYSNETHTDSPIVKVVSINSTTQSSLSASDSTTTANEIQITSEVSNAESSSTTILVVGILTESSIAAESSTVSSTEPSSTDSTTTTKSDNDEDNDEDESQNLFGETVHKEDEHMHEEVSSTSPASLDNSTSESSTQSTNAQIILTTQPDSSTKNAEESTSSVASELTTVSITTDSTQVPLIQVILSTSTEQSQVSTSELPLASSESSVAVNATERILTSFETSTKSDSESSSATATSTASSTETSTTVSVKVDETSNDQKPKVTLDTFTHFEDSNDNTLKVIPLTHKDLPATTTDSNLSTSENEITEKTETTGHFLEQTTFPSIKSESDEASNFREGKILPDHTGKNDTEKSQQSLEKDVVDKTKLFKQEFLDKLADQPSCADDKFKCAFTSDCIAKSKVCDGKAQCSDYSDEWNCFDLNNETNTLQVKQEDKFFKVCATQWTTDLSNKVCNKMGYSSAVEWKSNGEAVGKEEKYLVAKGGSLAEFEFVESCSDGLIEIECVSYECGSNSTSTVDSGEFSSISLVVNRDSSLRCTASIISPLWALTSAACVNQTDQEWILIAGSTELNMSKISKNSVISLIGNIVTYPDSDFALLELKQVLSFANQIYSACLNDWDTESSRDCLSTGWVVRESNNAYEKYEKIATVDRNCTTETDAVCVTPINMLSTECYNDKGSALYCYSESESRWLLNGIQNRQNGCRETSVFAGLSAKAIQWIKNTVGNSRMFV